MAAGAPDEKFQKLREENERRRKKKDEEDKRRKQEEEQKAKDALERRRQERLEQDERMRKPWQQPPAPKKTILKKGAKQKPVQSTSPSGDPVRQSQAEEKRREWRQGLQNFIKQQRQAAAVAKTPKASAPIAAGGSGAAGADGAAQVVPLTWEELRMAAEAGFDELLQQQELQAKQRAAEEPTSRAARHRSPYKSPFRGAPAPPQETVQVALVPANNYNSILANAQAAPPPHPASAAATGTSPPVRSRDTGPRSDAAAAAAAQRHSYKFSDAPGWPPVSPAAARSGNNNYNNTNHAAAGADASYAVGNGLRPGEAADGMDGDGDTAPSAVLYPPAPAPADQGDGAARGSWADSFSGLPGDPHTGMGPGRHNVSSVGSSTGLRRGVTAVARHRVTPVDAASLDGPPGPSQADLGLGPGPDDESVGDGGSSGGGGGSRHSPRGVAGQHWRAPLPGPYDAPSQQDWPVEEPHGGSRQEAAGSGGALRHLAVPAEPLEASLLADGRLEAMQQTEGFRLSSPRSTVADAYGHMRAPHDQQQHMQQHYPQYVHQQQPQKQPGGPEHRPARRGWGVPVQPPPGGAAQPPWARFPDPADTAAGDTTSVATGTSTDRSLGDQPAHVLISSGCSAAAVRHSVGVGESGGPEMWQRESVMLPGGGMQPMGAQPALDGSPQIGSQPEASPPRYREEAGGVLDGWQEPKQHCTPAQRQPVPVDMSADLVRFSSPSGLSGISTGSSPATSRLEQQQQLAQEEQEQHAGHWGDQHARGHDRHRLADVVTYRDDASLLDAASEGQELRDAGGPLAVLPSPEEGGAGGQYGERPAWGRQDGPRGSRPAAVLQAPQVHVQGPVSGMPQERQAKAGPPPQQQQQHLQQQQHQQQQQSFQGGLLPPFAPVAVRHVATRHPPPSAPHGASTPVPAAPPLTSPTHPAATAPLLAAGEGAGAASPAPPAAPPSQPPIRAPSPPSSPRRISGPQRFHRQHSASSLISPGPSPAAATVRCASTAPRPVSADSRTSADVTAPANQPPLPHPTSPPAPKQILHHHHQQQQQQNMTAVAPSPSAATRPSRTHPPNVELASARSAQVLQPESVSSGGTASNPQSPRAMVAIVLSAPCGQEAAATLSSVATAWQNQPCALPGNAAPCASVTTGSGTTPVVTSPRSAAADVRAVLCDAPGMVHKAPDVVSSGRKGGLATSHTLHNDPPVVAEEPSEEEVSPARMCPSPRALALAQAQDGLDPQSASWNVGTSGPTGGEGKQRLVAAGDEVARRVQLDGEASMCGRGLIRAHAISTGQGDVEEEEGVDAATAADSRPTTGSSRGLDSRGGLGSPSVSQLAPGMADGSVLTGSHISARPWSGPRGGPMEPASRLDSPYQASLLDDSVSSFDFKARSGGVSRPASASCVPPNELPLQPPQPMGDLGAVPPARNLLYPEAHGDQPPMKQTRPAQVAQRQSQMQPVAQQQRSNAVTTAVESAAKGRHDAGPSKALSTGVGPGGTPLHGRQNSGQSATARASDGHLVRKQAATDTGAALSHAAAGVPAAAAAGQVSHHGNVSSSTVALAPASNSFQVLQRPAVVTDPYGVYGSGDGQALNQEPVDQPRDESGVASTDGMPPLRQHPQQHQRQQSQSDEVQPMPAAVSTAAAAVAAPEADLEDLMREIQELSALRKALKAEFESMGHGDAVAGLRTLPTNFVMPRVGLEDGAAAAAVAPLPPPTQPQAQPQPQQGLVHLPSQQALAPVATGPQPAPLQWVLPSQPYAAGAPSAANTSNRSAAAAPQALPPEPERAQRTPEVVALPPTAASRVDQMIPTMPPSNQGSTPAAPQLAYPDQPVLQEPLPLQPIAPPSPPTLPPGSSTPGVGLGPSGFVAPSSMAPAPKAGSFAFPAGPPPQSDQQLLPAPLPLAQQPMPHTAPLPVLPVLPQPQPAVAPAALQWTIPMDVGAGGEVGAAAPRSCVPSRGPSQVSRGEGGAGASATSRKGAQAPRRTPSGGGHAASPAVDSPSGKSVDSRGSTRGAHSAGGALPLGTATGTAGGRGGGLPAAAAAATPTERPLINEGSYAQAAVQARERSERERAAREALQAEAAAAKAVAAQRSKSEKGTASTQQSSAMAAAPTRETAPLGLKAPSTIGSYVRQASPSPARPAPALRAVAGGVDAGSAVQKPSIESHDAVPTSTPPPGTQPSWSTPPTTRPSRIPTPSRARNAPPASASADTASKPQPSLPANPTPATVTANNSSPGGISGEDSLFDFLERASDVSDTETESPEAYGVSSSRTQPQPAARREAFSSPSATAAATASAAAAYRERLAEARPQPLRIPDSAVGTQVGATNTASTVASRAVPTGGRAARAGGAAVGGGGQGGGGRAGGKPATPFTAAIRELMGLPGSAPLEQSRAAAGQQQQQQQLPHRQQQQQQPPGAREAGSRAPRLSEDEDNLLASLQRLDGEILRRGLAAAGILNDPLPPPQPASEPGMPNGAKGAAAKGVAVKGGKGVKAGKVGAAEGKAAGPLTNSLQQDQLRESLERLDVRLGALRRKMEDRACALGMPSATPTPTAAAPPSAPVPTSAPGTIDRNKRDPTPPRDDRRERPPATLAKSRTPTPNKAKAIRDQRQQQLSAAQGPVPPPARAPPPASVPPKPASAPVAAAEAPLPPGSFPPQQTLHHPPVAASNTHGASSAPGGPRHGMPPRPPAARAPASAPSGPAIVNAAQQQQHQQQPPQYQQPFPQQQNNFMAPPSAVPYGGVLPPPGAVMQPMAYGVSPPSGGQGMSHSHQQQQQQQLQSYQQQQQFQNHHQQQQAPQQQQVAYVAAMLPNGQMAYVPQFVPTGAAGGVGFPGFFPQGPGGMAGGPGDASQQMQMQMPMQQPMGMPMQQMPMSLQQNMPGGAMLGGSMVMGQMPPKLQQGGGPMHAWGSMPGPQAPQQPYGGGAYMHQQPPSPQQQPPLNQYHNGTSGGGSPSLYSFERSASGGLTMGGGNTADGAYGSGQTLQYGTGPPPSGPLPHYQSTVMRVRSIGSRDGEALAAAAAAAGLTSPQAPHLAHAQAQQQQQQQLQQQLQANPSMQMQPQSQPPQRPQPGQGPPPPHPVQVQTFGPGGGSSRGLGATGGWGLGAAGGGAAGGGGAGGDAGVIKAVNLGLLLS